MLLPSKGQLDSASPIHIKIAPTDDDKYWPDPLDGENLLSYLEQKLKMYALFRSWQGNREADSKYNVQEATTP